MSKYDDLKGFVREALKNQKDNGYTRDPDASVEAQEMLNEDSDIEWWYTLEEMSDMDAVEHLKKTIAEVVAEGF